MWHELAKYWMFDMIEETPDDKADAYESQQRIELRKKLGEVRRFLIANNGNRSEQLRQYIVNNREYPGDNFQELALAMIYLFEKGPDKVFKELEKPPSREFNPVDENLENYLDSLFGDQLE